MTPARGPAKNAGGTRSGSKTETVLGLLLGFALTGGVAAILGAVTLRLGGHFLSLSTIAWGLATYFLFGNLPWFGQFTGISDVLEAGYGGYLSTYSNAPNAARLTDGLGTDWEAGKIGYKPHACVTSIHSALDALALWPTPAPKDL